jgi:hypothetical protein
LLKVPVAVKDCTWPTEIVLAVGVMSIVCNLGFAAIAAVVSSPAYSTVATLTRKVRGVRMKGNIETPLRHLDRRVRAAALLVLGMPERNERTTTY